VSVRNETLIPTRTGQAARRNIGIPDVLTVAVEGAEVVAAGRLRSWIDERMSPVEHEPSRVLVPEGVGSQDERIFRFIVEGPKGVSLYFSYSAEKAREVNTSVTLGAAQQTPRPAPTEPEQAKQGR
jgi:hypothetical protein